MKLKIIQSICCNFEIHYELKYEGVAHAVSGDAGLVAFLKRRFGMAIEDGFVVADQFLKFDELDIVVCYSRFI